MPVIKTELELKLYNALRLIAKGYDSAERLLRSGECEYGLSGEEVLTYAYENMQEEAKFALKGVRVERSLKLVSNKERSKVFKGIGIIQISGKIVGTARDVNLDLLNAAMESPESHNP